MTRGTFRRRRLARELRTLREASGLTSEAVADAADISQSSLSRTENALVQIKVNTVRRLLQVYGVTGEQHDALVALAREANRLGWWHTYGDVLPEWFEVFVDLEGEADTLSVYDSQFINGLLQTEGYARALLASARPEDDAAEVTRRVELRMQRQARVADGRLRIRLIVDECVLHRVYGDTAVMPGQLARLAEMAGLPNVSLQVLPSNSRAGAVGSFTVLEFPDPADPPVVYIENEIGALYMEKPEQVRQYSRLWDHLRAAALSPEASVSHIAHLLKE